MWFILIHHSHTEVAVIKKRLSHSFSFTKLFQDYLNSLVLVYFYARLISVVKKIAMDTELKVNNNSVKTI